MGLIKPISFIGLGQCPFCGCSLVILENEQNVLFLDKNGLPREMINTNYSTKAHCVGCNEDFYAEKKGMHYTIQYRVRKIVDEYNKQVMIEKENDNPFTIKVKVST